MRHVGLLMVLLELGCVGEAPGPFAGSQSPISEQREMVTGSAQLAFGADCSSTGNSGCASGECLHVGTGYVCSMRCGPTTTCPAGWGCTQVFPASAAFYCAPAVGDGGVR
jgi:hypothetical protein